MTPAARKPFQKPTPTFGPDVFEGDGDVDWKAVAAQGGARFGIFKISEGIDRVDSRATAERVKAIRAAGLTAGAYHYLHPRPGRSGADEARAFIERGLALGLWQRDHQTVRDLRPVLDFEETHFPTDTVLGRYRTRKYLREAINEVRALTGHNPIIYTGGPFWDQFGFRWNLKCPLWLAAYVPRDQLKRYVPRPWRSASLWQLTDQHKTPGISEPCDWSVFLGGDLNDFRKQLTF